MMNGGVAPGGRLRTVSYTHLRAARQIAVFLVAGNDPLHGAGHTAQVGSIHIRVNIQNRLHIVVAHGAEFRAGRDGRQVAQNLNRWRNSRHRGRRGGNGLLRRSRAGDGQALQRRQRVEAILRGLDGHVVGYPVFGIEIEVGGGLEASAQGHQQALRHILLRQTDGLGAGAVHVHRHIGIVEGLLNARIDCAGHIADLIEHALCDCAVAIQVRADDLDIDGRGEAEVENLGHDVHRQHIKSHAGILAIQLLAQSLHVGRGGMVVLGCLLYTSRCV